MDDTEELEELGDELEVKELEDELEASKVTIEELEKRLDERDDELKASKATIERLESTIHDLEAHNNFRQTSPAGVEAEHGSDDMISLDAFEEADFGPFELEAARGVSPVFPDPPFNWATPGPLPEPLRSPSPVTTLEPDTPALEFVPTTEPSATGAQRYFAAPATVISHPSFVSELSQIVRDRLRGIPHPPPPILCQGGSPPR